MTDFSCNLLNRKTKSNINVNLLNSEIQNPFSTRFNSSACPSPIPHQFSQINDEALFSSNEEMVLSHLIKDDDSLNACLGPIFPLKNDFDIKENESQNLLPIQNNTIISNAENKENEITEIIECKNILTQLKEKNHISIIINTKGRKTNEQKASDIKGKHTKDSKDNKLRKVKVIAFETVLQTINSLLIITDANKKLKKLKDKQIKELNVEYNKKLLITKIKDIFSNDISSVYVDSPDYNENVINSIYKEKEKYQKVITVLEKTFEQCFQDFRDEKNENELNKTLKKICDEKLEKETTQYKNDIKDIINNFEKIFREIKKPRKPRKK